MRAYEFLPEVTRRDVLKGLGAAGLAAAGVSAQAGPGGQHLPEPPSYAGGADVKFHQQAWARLPANIKQQWQARQANLTKRVQAIYARLLQQMPAQDRQKLQGVRISVPVDRAVYANAVANLARKTLELDLGTFWDLSDNTLAYTIGHEIGHFVVGDNLRQYGKFSDMTNDQYRQVLAKMRQGEIDADAYGARIAYRAGFDPRDAFKQFTQEARQEKESENDTHPSLQRRQQEFDSVIQRLTPQQQQQKLKQISHVLRGIQSLSA
jgi:hypothetical protein